MGKGLKRAVVTGAALLSTQQVAAQLPSPTPPILFFDFFLFDNGGLPDENHTTFLLWNVTGGSVDLVGGVGPGVIGAPPAQPLGRYVDLGGSTGNPGLFETRQLLDLIPGATYNLSFQYRSTLAGQLNSATASFGGFSYDVSSSTENFVEFSTNLTVDSLLTSRIAFQGAEGDTDNSGIGIDSILLRLVTLPGGVTPTIPGLPLPASDAPEPATWASMILGFGVVGLSLRRRRKAVPTN